MKNKTILFICTGILLSILPACQKYDEGSNISIRTAKHRVAGSWNLAIFTINSQNMLNFSYYDNFVSSCSTTVDYTETFTTVSYVWNMAADGDFAYNRTMQNRVLDYTGSYNSCAAYYIDQVAEDADSGKWQFQENNTKLKLVWTNGDVQVFDIIELREKRMQLRATISGQLWEMTFEQL